ncbi:uncharacterized protein LOC123905266 [Trifolium pratense]|uniref:Uncharacterized protein n=1 Tax=Trifolium pratense TaxID=57577 RepID=A0ACB0JNT9_TRIPR|nr:uncharacterized protein LOC123905266 [Trifolium pratense]CAJ2645107.1 unnamed protein product [Trifolium pratense]
MAAVQELMLLLQQIRPCVDSLDRRKWSSGTAGLFTVKSAYICLQNKYGMAEIELAKVQALQQLWLNNVPPKVNIFGWRLLLEKLPTREALYRKGIITSNHERCCVFCFKEKEDVQHAFFQL